MAAETSRLVLRYLPAQRLTHWVGASGFLILLVTGLILEWPPLSALAAGGWSRWLHRVGAVMYVLWPVLYAVLDPKGLREVVRESLTYGRDEFEWFKRMPAYLLGHATQMPPQGRINAGQKLHHLAIGVMSVVVVATGLLLWFGKGQLGPGGLSITAMSHGIAMLVLTVLFVGHCYFSCLYRALPAMLTGYVTESYARLEHSKWLATLHATSSVTQSTPDITESTPARAHEEGREAPERQTQPSETKEAAAATVHPPRRILSDPGG